MKSNNKMSNFTISAKYDDSYVDNYLVMLANIIGMWRPNSKHEHLFAFAGTPRANVTNNSVLSPEDSAEIVSGIIRGLHMSPEHRPKSLAKSSLEDFLLGAIGHVLTVNYIKRVHVQLSVQTDGTISTKVGAISCDYTSSDKIVEFSNRLDQLFPAMHAHQVFGKSRQTLDYDDYQAYHSAMTMLFGTGAHRAAVILAIRCLGSIHFSNLVWNSRKVDGLGLGEFVGMATADTMPLNSNQYVILNSKRELTSVFTGTPDENMKLLNSMFVDENVKCNVTPAVLKFATIPLSESFVRSIITLASLRRQIAIVHRTPRPDKDAGESVGRREDSHAAIAAVYAESRNRDARDARREGISLRETIDSVRRDESREEARHKERLLRERREDTRQRERRDDREEDTRRDDTRYRRDEPSYDERVLELAIKAAAAQIAQRLEIPAPQRYDAPVRHFTQTDEYTRRTPYGGGRVNPDRTATRK